MRRSVIVVCIYSAFLSAYTDETRNRRAPLAVPAPVVMAQNTHNGVQRQEQTNYAAHALSVIARAFVENILYCQRY